MKKIRFDAVVRSNAAAINIARINSAKLVPLIGKRVKVTVVPLLEDHIERYENHVSKLEETVSKKEWDKCNKVKSSSYSEGGITKVFPLSFSNKITRICAICNGLIDEPSKKCKSWIHPIWEQR